ncbi:MBL fold metallo-hydrolase [Hyphomicrobiales bacterium]|uniref:MBL fold metallo-hydrolase n=1 Tax=Ensifer sp. R-19 TaxID=3404055 RepID=UPI000DDF2F98
MSEMSMKRRTLMGAGTSGVLAAPSLLTGAAVAEEKAENTDMKSAPPIRSLKLGAFKVIVVNDGARVTEKPHEIYGTNQSQQAVAELLQQNFLPTEALVNSFSPVLVDTGTDVVLFDTGMGEGGREAGMGRLAEGIRAAGYAPEQVSVVVVTHMHGDHIGGLMEAGKPAFANARYVMGETEYAFWKDPARAGTPAENGAQGGAGEDSAAGGEDDFHRRRRRGRARYLGRRRLRSFAGSHGVPPRFRRQGHDADGRYRQPLCAGAAAPRLGSALRHGQDEGGRDAP